jgi:hypothetical protein
MTFVHEHRSVVIPPPHDEFTSAVYRNTGRYIQLVNNGQFTLLEEPVALVYGFGQFLVSVR